MKKKYFDKERLMNTCFSIFKKPITNIVDSDPVNIFDVYDWIKERYLETTLQLRELTDKSQIAEFKKSNFHCVTFSGFFSIRNDNSLIQHSNLICIDVDGLSSGKIRRIKALLKSDPYLIMFFVSPTGTGLKIIYPIDISSMGHDNWYKIYANHVIESYHLEESAVDMSCKNVSRACFICHDSQVFLNPGIENGDNIYPIEPREKENLQISYESYEPYEFDLNQGMNLADRNAEQNFFMLIKKVESKLGAIRKGNRHNWFVSLAGSCNTWGMELDISKMYAVKYFVQHVEIVRKDDPMSIDEIVKPFQDIYSKYSDQFSTWSDNEPSGKIQDNDNTDLIPNGVYEVLPGFLKRLCEHFNERERDVFFVGLIGTLSACFRNVVGRYSKASFYPNLYLFVTAPPGSGKSMIRFGERIVRPIHDKMRTDSAIAIQEYEKMKREYEKDKSLPRPGERPTEKMLFMPGNSSGTAILQTIADNDGSGIIFETEADTLASAISKEWGDFSDFIRKAFQHETVSYKRRTGNEYVEISCPKLSIVLSGTPNQVTSLIKSIENGLFSRFVFYAFKSEVVWKNPFEESNELEFEQLIKDSSNQLKEYYDYLESFKEVTFKLTESQITIFNKSFTETLSDLKNELGEGIVGSVFRLGIIAFRIAMLLSILRSFEDGTISNIVICDDQDFESALIIANILKAHTAFVFEHNISSDYNAKLKPEPQRYYQALPDDFKRSEANSVAAKIGLHPKTGEKYLDDYLSKNMLTRVKHGHYSKLKTEVS